MYVQCEVHWKWFLPVVTSHHLAWAEPNPATISQQTVCTLFLAQFHRAGKKNSHNPAVLHYLISLRESLSWRDGWVSVIIKPTACFCFLSWWYITSSSTWYTFKDLEMPPYLGDEKESNYLVCLSEVTHIHKNRFNYQISLVALLGSRTVLEHSCF